MTAATRAPSLRRCSFCGAVRSRERFLGAAFFWLGLFCFRHGSVAKGKEGANNVEQVNPHAIVAAPCTQVEIEWSHSGARLARRASSCLSDGGAVSGPQRRQSGGKIESSSATFLVSERCVLHGGGLEKRGASPVSLLQNPFPVLSPGPSGGGRVQHHLLHTAALPSFVFLMCR